MLLVFMHIMESPVSGIFSIRVFNNIMEVTFIFSPRRSFKPLAAKPHNIIIFNNIQFFDFSPPNR